MAARRRRSRRRPHRHLSRPARLRRERQARRERPRGLLQAHHGPRRRPPRRGAGTRPLHPGRPRPRCPGRVPRRHGPPGQGVPRAVPRHPADPRHVERPARRVRRGRLPPLPDGAAPRPAGADDRGGRTALLRVLPRRLDRHPGRDPRRDPRALPRRVRGGRAVHRRRLPRLRRRRRGTRHRRQGGGQPAGHARHRPPAGLGRGPRIPRPEPVERLVRRPAPPHGLLRSLHGRGGSRNDRRGDQGPRPPLTPTVCR
ncbi:Epoxide hydrolase [Streptomyces misionensis JCM 4497]